MTSRSKGLIAALFTGWAIWRLVAHQRRATIATNDRGARPADDSDRRGRPSPVNVLTPRRQPRLVLEGATYLVLSAIVASAALLLWPLRDSVSPPEAMPLEVISNWPVSEIYLYLNDNPLELILVAVGPTPTSIDDVNCRTAGPGEVSADRDFLDTARPWNMCSKLTFHVPDRWAAHTQSSSEASRGGQYYYGVLLGREMTLSETGERVDAVGAAGDWRSGKPDRFASGFRRVRTAGLDLAADPLASASNGRDTVVSLPRVVGVPAGTTVKVITDRPVDDDDITWESGVIVADHLGRQKWEYQTNGGHPIARGTSPRVVAADQRNTFIAGVLSGVAGGFLVAAVTALVTAAAHR